MEDATANPTKQLLAENHRHILFCLSDAFRLFFHVSDERVHSARPKAEPLITSVNPVVTSTVAASSKTEGMPQNFQPETAQRNQPITAILEQSAWVVGIAVAAFALIQWSSHPWFSASSIFIINQTVKENLQPAMSSTAIDTAVFAAWEQKHGTSDNPGDLFRSHFFPKSGGTVLHKVIFAIVDSFGAERQCTPTCLPVDQSRLKCRLTHASTAHRNL